MCYITHTHSMLELLKLRTVSFGTKINIIKFKKALLFFTFILVVVGF